MILSKQYVIFSISLFIFIITAVIGWNKLHYGFNFIDEGYHMTESWRLTAGDHFLKDKFTGALRHYTLINSLIFKVCPDITLLGFRKLQFSLTIFSLILLSIALYTSDRQFCYQPLIFSLFAFTGLDPIGMISNLYYQTYPHLFIVFHLSFFIFGLFQEKPIIRKTFFVLSGFCLWGISLSLLHLSVIIVSPFLLFILSKIRIFQFFSFTFSDLIAVFSPFLLCWIVFLACYNQLYILNVINSVQLLLSISTYSPDSLININWEAIKHVSVSFVFLIAFILCIKMLPFRFAFISTFIISAIMFFTIKTSLFGLIKPYWNGWFSSPMWFASMLIAFSFMFWFSLLKKYVFNNQFSEGEELALILLLPANILFIVGSIFSGLGVLSVVHYSIPVIAAMAVTFINKNNICNKSYAIKFILLTLFLVPFYYTTALDDWHFTFFDVSPNQMETTIESGFGSGIKTNQDYYNLYKWISHNAEGYSNDDDFIISYVVSPMVHMISKRRPALDDSFISHGELPYDYLKETIKFMKKRNRKPSLAFIFESMPGLSPLSMENNQYQWFNKQFVFSSQTKDPISRYILDNMVIVDEFTLSKDNKVRCFVDKKDLIERKLDEKIANLQKSLEDHPHDHTIHYMLGLIYQKKGMENKALPHYKEALDAKPDFINALNQIAFIFAEKDNYQKAVDTFAKIIEIQPDNADSYYNIACLYAKQKQTGESIEWLKLAFDRGFGSLNLLQNDSDLNNIRNTEEFRNIVNQYFPHVQ